MSSMSKIFHEHLEGVCYKTVTDGTEKDCPIQYFTHKKSKDGQKLLESFLIGNNNPKTNSLG